MVTRRDCSRDHEEDQVPLEPGQREHLDGEQIAGREALPVRLQERVRLEFPILSLDRAAVRRQSWREAGRHAGYAPDFVFNSASCSVRNARISSVMASNVIHCSL